MTPNDFSRSPVGPVPMRPQRGPPKGRPLPSRSSTGVRQVTPDQMEPGPTESDTGCGWILLSPGCGRSRYYRVTHGTGPILNEAQVSCRTLGACLVPPTEAVHSAPQVPLGPNPKRPPGPQDQD